MAYRTKKPAGGRSRYGGMSYAKVRRKKSKKLGGRYGKRKTSWSSGKAAATGKRTPLRNKKKRTVKT